jgi:hypothetical protein
VFFWQSDMRACIPCIQFVLTADRRPTVKQILELPSVAKAARYDNVNVGSSVADPHLDP